ncbi:hypothetical protein MJO28_008030 [Puccinia striiformis f. sp. tritici]|nr:hypothetical protein Pst134EA_015902 [Puccinia striiformis f. sp. tritici]KAH9463821.1 hypothetical protein Pst134EA_015902 [Puccinia striiformis f. sp. tritici]KAI7949209.1 hypothetical protein MJO28_008030 [Puccinia striiformis f. sp. tritici]
MVSYRLVVSLFNMGRSLQQAGKPAPLDITCSRKKQIHPVDCVSAYQKIIYDGDSTLDINESSLERASGTCVTRIENPKFLKVPKAKIEDAFNRMGAKCNGFAGWASLPGFDGVQLWVRHHTRGGVRYEDDMELHHPFCYADTERKLVVADCMEAYRLLPTNPEGRFVTTDTHQIMNTVHVDFKSCAVWVYTSDGSKIAALKKDLDGLPEKLMGECNTKGGILLTKGAVGKNGNLILGAYYPGIELWN